MGLPARHCEGCGSNFALNGRFLGQFFINGRMFKRNCKEKMKGVYASAAEFFGGIWRSLSVSDQETDRVRDSTRGGQLARVSSLDCELMYLYNVISDRCTIKSVSTCCLWGVLYLSIDLCSVKIGPFPALFVTLFLADSVEMYVRQAEWCNVGRTEALLGSDLH